MKIFNNSKIFTTAKTNDGIMVTPKTAVTQAEEKGAAPYAPNNYRLMMDTLPGKYPCEGYIGVAEAANNTRQLPHLVFFTEKPVPEITDDEHDRISDMCNAFLREIGIDATSDWYLFDAMYDNNYADNIYSNGAIFREADYDKR